MDQDYCLYSLFSSADTTIINVLLLDYSTSMEIFTNFTYNLWLYIAA